MFNKRTKTLSLTLAVVLLALALSAGKLPGAETGGRRLSADLSGAAEVPGPGDPDGSGWAEITLNHGQGTVCWHIMVSDLTLPAAGAHIHEGSADVAGPVVVALSAPDESGMSSGCTTADKALIKEIMHEMDEYYVNVHTSDYPAGAVRGQLDK